MNKKLKEEAGLGWDEAVIEYPFHTENIHIALSFHVLE